MKYKVCDKIKIKQEKYLKLGIKESEKMGTRIGTIKDINNVDYYVETDKFIMWCTDEGIEELLPKTITNRQWLESLSNEELAKVLSKIEYCDGQFLNEDDFCASCNMNSYCFRNWGSNIFLEWLQAEHKE